MCIRFMSGNREISEGAVVSLDSSRAGEGQGRNPGVYTSEKSDRPIVQRFQVIIFVFQEEINKTGNKRKD